MIAFSCGFYSTKLIRNGKAKQFTEPTAYSTQHTTSTSTYWTNMREFIYWLLPLKIQFLWFSIISFAVANCFYSLDSMIVLNSRRTKVVKQQMINNNKIDNNHNEWTTKTEHTQQEDLWHQRNITYYQRMWCLVKARQNWNSEFGTGSIRMITRWDYKCAWLRISVVNYECK